MKITTTFLYDPLQHPISISTGQICALQNIESVLSNLLDDTQEETFFIHFYNL